MFVSGRKDNEFCAGPELCVSRGAKSDVCFWRRRAMAVWDRGPCMGRGAWSDSCVFGAQDDVCCAPLRAMCVLWGAKRCVASPCRAMGVSSGSGAM